MKKMIMVVMMVMAIMTGCTNDMRHAGKMYITICRPGYFISFCARMDAEKAVENVMNYNEEKPYISDEYLKEVAFNGQKNDWAN